MKYYINRKLEISFEDAIEKVIYELKKEGFGILTDSDIRQTFKNRLGVNFRNYRILGACNPSFAYRALQIDDKIGTMLPCNVIVEEIDENTTQVAAIDPPASMLAVDNEDIKEIANEIKSKLQRVMNSL